MFLEIDRITSETLECLIAGSFSVCRIPHFLSDSLCQLYSKKILGFSQKEFYAVNKKVGKIGSAIFDYAFHPQQVEEYFKNIDVNNQNLKMIFGEVSPAQLFFNTLNALWKCGCAVENFYGKKAYYGIIRLFEKAGTAPPHQDMTAWDIKDCPEAQSIQKQFSVNIYLQTPLQGGDLIVYDKRISDEAQYQKKFFDYLNIGHVKAHQELLSQIIQCVSIKPQTGDLIIFNSQKMHAVSDNLTDTTRITQGFFINYRGNDIPLRVFS